MRLLAWLGGSGTRLSLALALVFFALHVTGELRVLRGGSPGFVGRLERTALDVKLADRGARPPGRWDVAVAAIDEAAIRVLGRFPWTRDRHARLVDRLTELGAKVIAFDVTFADPASIDARGPAVLGALQASGLDAASRALELELPGLQTGAAQLEASRDPGARAVAPSLVRVGRAVRSATAAVGRLRAAGRRTSADPDAVFAEAIRRSGRVVLGVVSYSSAEAEAMSSASLAESLARVSSATISEVVQLGDGLSRVDPRSAEHFERAIYRRFFGVQAPAPALSAATPYFGTINAFPDDDGVIRRVPLVSGLSGVKAVLPSLALQAVAVAERPSPIELIGDADAPLPDAIQIGDRRIETELDAAVTLDWYGDFQSSELPVLSIAGILDGSVPAEAVRGRIVFVAATAVGTYDQRVTPLSRAVPGIFVHATLAQNILDRRHLVRPLWVVFLELIVMLAVGGVAGVAMSRLRAPGQVAFGLGLAAAWLSFDRFVLFEGGLVVSPVLPTVQIVATTMAMAVWRFLDEERERRKTRQAFQRYLAPAVMEQVLAHPEEYLRLGGRRYEATVLFSDIRGFTTISERLSPEELGKLLNLYMTPMTDLVFATGGTLDKYIGDAVMAFWGAPVEQSDHAVRACRTALRMMEEVRRLNHRFEQEGLPTIAIGIGLSTGPMTIGNMGSDDFFSYTALGDRVNLGARLEGQTKDYGVDIIVSEACHEAARAAMSFRELGAIKVKGKTQPVRIYELVREGPLEGEQKAAVDVFHHGLAAFRGRRWEDAIAHFQSAKTLRGGIDRTADDYVDQCLGFKVSPPPPDWDGTRVATSK